MLKLYRSVISHKLYMSTTTTSHEKHCVHNPVHMYQAITQSHTKSELSKSVRSVLTQKCTSTTSHEKQCGHNPVHMYQAVIWSLNSTTLSDPYLLRNTCPLPVMKLKSTVCTQSCPHQSKSWIQSMNSASPSDQYLEINAIFILTFWILVWHYSISLPRNTRSVFELIFIILCLHRARGGIFYHIQLCSQELTIQRFFCHARFWNKKKDSNNYSVLPLKCKSYVIDWTDGWGSLTCASTTRLNKYITPCPWSKTN